MLKKSLPLLLAAAAAALPAGAQERFADDPLVGIALPAGPLAGDHDATATVLNPAGLPFLGGAHLEVAATARAGDGVQSGGAGVGVYLGAPLALPFLPRLGFGVAVEKLLPPVDTLAPDPGRPLRLSLAGGCALGDAAAVGAAWRHNAGEGGGTLQGVDSLDLGVSLRAGSHFAIGLVLHDALPPTVDGVPLQRRWDGELVGRPLGTDRLELAVGAAIGERRGDVDARARLGVRLARGLALRASGELRTHRVLDSDETRSELVGSLGLEVSFGELGAAAYATISSGPGDARFAGMTGIARFSGERYPSVLPRGDRIERLKIGSPDERELTRMLMTLRRYERDDGVRAVFLQLDGVSAGWATIEELRDAVARLRARGKKVYAYLVAGGTRDVYLASACDKILLDAGGGLRLLGLSTASLHFRELFDKLGVDPQFEKIEEYKSAPEMFTMDAPSEPAVRQRAEMLDDVYRRVVAGIAAGRKLPVERARELVEQGPYTAAEAVAAGVADVLVEPTDLDKLLTDELGDGIELGEGPLAERPQSWRLPRIAVVYLDGDIVDGKSREVPLIGQKVAGGETLAAALNWAREEPSVRAVVLRIDSPGGSAVASEQIARAGFRLRGVKPFVVSIGDVAASGGYFAAAPGEVIYAEPSSVTGSIGIFTGKFDLSGLLSRIGITWQTMTRGPHADMESMLRPYSDEERATIKQKLRYYYLRFVDAVAKGRGMTQAEVDAVGHGRVWTAAQARPRKLVDRHGGLYDAVAEAKRRAGLDDDERVELVLLPRVPSSLLGKLARLAGGDEAQGQGQTGDALAPLRPLLRRLPASLLLEPGAMQARMPMVLVED